MIEYVQYDPDTGQILSWGYGNPPDNHIEYSAGDDVTNCKVDLATMTVVKKDMMELILPTASYPADGITEGVIGNIPRGTVCDFMLLDDFYCVDVDDGTLELAVYDPMVVNIHFWHPTKMHPNVLMEFV